MSDLDLLEAETQWPPDYNIRHSERAKRISVRVSRHGLIEVVLPKRMAKRHAEPALNELRPWVEKQLAKIKVPIIEQQLPESLNLTALTEDYSLQYLPRAFKPRVVAQDNHLLISVDKDNFNEGRMLLIHWLKQKARRVLIPWLHRLSQEHDLPFNEVRVGGQTSLWGSCTVEKNISLNYKLLFLPTNLVEHTLLHELCHTRHLNHSQAFWSLLASIDKDYTENKQQLKQAQHYIPVWAEI